MILPKKRETSKLVDHPELGHATILEQSQCSSLCFLPTSLLTCAATKTNRRAKVTVGMIHALKKKLIAVSDREITGSTQSTTPTTVVKTSRRMVRFDILPLVLWERLR